jgi:hypothetical protein
MRKGVVYYTDNRLDPRILGVCQRQLEYVVPCKVVCVSLEPENFGMNVILAGRKPGATTLFHQILAGLYACDADIIFLAEHDVLYHQTHFDFDPPNPQVYYYNANNWRWDYPKNRLITYDHLRSLSGLCAYREVLIDHYQRRLDYIKAMNLPDERDPGWARKMGYEPGKAQPYFPDMPLAEWCSESPNIDIRHGRTHTPRKVTLDSFRQQPVNWQETTLDKIPEWNLREMFGLC